MVLVSGGVESAALLSYYRHWDHSSQLLPLFVDYGEAASLLFGSTCCMCVLCGCDVRSVCWEWGSACARLPHPAGQKNVREEEKAQKVRALRGAWARCGLLWSFPSLGRPLPSL